MPLRNSKKTKQVAPSSSSSDSDTEFQRKTAGRFRRVRYEPADSDDEIPSNNLSESEATPSLKAVSMEDRLKQILNNTEEVLAELKAD